MKKKKLILILLYFAFYPQLIAQDTVRAVLTKPIGFVKLKNSNLQGLPDVRVRIGEQLVVVSKADGSFQFDIASVFADTLSIRAEKEGYINSSFLLYPVDYESLQIGGRPTPDFVIVMEKTDVWLKRRQTFQNSLSEHMVENNSRAMQKLYNRIATSPEGAASILKKQFNSLQLEREIFFSWLKVLGAKLAYIDTDFCSQGAKLALASIASGNIREAIRHLPDSLLDHELQLAKERNFVKLAVQNYVIKARLLVVNRQFAPAYQTYNKAILADPQNAEILVEFATFCSKSKQNEAAIKHFNNALRFAKRDHIKADALYNQAMHCLDIGDHIQASLVGKEALEIYEGLRKKSPFQFENSVLELQLILGEAYMKLNSLEQAESAFTEARNLAEKLSQKYPLGFEFSIAVASGNLGKISMENKDYENAIAAFEEALPRYKRFAKINDQIYEPTVTFIESQLVLAYAEEEKFGKARKMLNGFLTNYKALAKEEPKQFSEQLCYAYLNMAKLDRKQLEATQDISFQKHGKAMIRAAKNQMWYLEKRPIIHTKITDLLKPLDTYFQEVDIETLEAQSYITQIDSMQLAARDEQNPSLQATVQEAIIKELASALELHPKNEKLALRCADAYGELAGAYIFAQKFLQAEIAAVKGLELAPDQDWIYTKLAVSLLYQGKMKEAQKIYRQYRNKDFGKRTFREAFLEDLDALEAVGITCEGVASIRAMLE